MVKQVIVVLGDGNNLKLTLTIIDLFRPMVRFYNHATSEIVWFSGFEKKKKLSPEMS